MVSFILLEEIEKLKKALGIAAEDAYREEVLDCGMEELTLDEYFTKEDWISDKIAEWFERSANV